MILAALILLLPPPGPPTAKGERLLELEWVAPGECPGPREVMDRLALFLRGPVPDAELPWAAGHVHGEGLNFVLELDIRAGEIEEHHRIVAGECDALGRFAGLLIAGAVEPLLFADPEDGADFEAGVVPGPRARVDVQRPSVADNRARVETPPRPSRAELPPAPPSSFELEARETGETKARAKPSFLLVRGSASGAVGVLPSAAGGLSLGLEFEHRWFRLGTVGSAWFGAGFRGQDAPEVGGNLWAWSVSLAPCGVPRWGAVSFPVCARVGAGQLRGRGVGVPDPQTNGQPWLWVGGDVGLDWWVRPKLALGLALGLAGSPVRPSFTIAGSSANFVTGPVFGYAQLGIALRFGGQTKFRSARSLQGDLDSEL